ncbi:MAG TPA: hypothetical protein VH092_13465 [Urbifossiella sp.]|nr:hypothetical protein [Urbifossiella sp.]
MPACRCQFCATPLEPVQEFRYLVETATADDPVHLARIRGLPHAGGRPLRVCKGCQGEIVSHPGRFRIARERAELRREIRSGVIAAAGLLSVAWFFTAVLGDV